MTQLCSVYIRDNILYLAERTGTDIAITTKQYDSISGSNMPSSLDAELPTDEVVLSQYTVDNLGGVYSFEYRKGEPSGYVHYIRDYNLKKDIFLVYDTIVHVQDYEPTDVKLDEAIGEITSKIKFSDHTPESFFDIVDEALGKAGVDLEKEMEKLVFEKTE